MRITAWAVAVAAVVGVSIWAAGVEGSASGASVGGGTLTKSGRDLTTGSTSTVRGGDTVQYVLSATNDTGSAATVHMHDDTGAGQTVDTNSVKAPPGYTVSATASTVDATGPAVPGSKGSSTPIPAPSSGTIATGDSDGDGYQAIFFEDRVYNVHHHTDETNKTIDCHVRSTGASCPRVDSGTWPAGGLNVLPTDGTSLTDADTSLFTSSSPFVYQDGGRIFVPVGVSGQRDAGVVCIDLVSETSCGYRHVYATANPVIATASTDPTGIAGGAQIGTKFFVVGDTGQVYCGDLNSPGFSCPGTWPVQAILPASAPDDEAAASAQVRTFDNGAHLYVSYVTVTPSDVVVHVGCVDVAADQPCSGFAPASAPGPGAFVANRGYDATKLLPVLDASGHQTGICVEANVGNVPDALSCWDNSGSSIADPYPAPADIDPSYAGGIDSVGWTGGGAPAVEGSRVYYDVLIETNSVFGEQYVCHDFAEPANSVCSGFHTTLMGPMPTTGWPPIKAYTLTPDPQASNCIWVVGDTGLFDVLDANSGKSAVADGSVPGCNPAHTAAELSVTPNDFYCDGSTHHTSTYDQLTLTGLPQGLTFTGTLTLTDQHGATVASVPVSQASFPFDLSAYATGTITTLHATLTMDVQNGVTWPSTEPTLHLTFKGDAAQVCFQAKAADNCDQSMRTLTDSATLEVNGQLAARANFGFTAFQAAATCPKPVVTVTPPPSARVDAASTTRPPPLAHTGAPIATLLLLGLLLAASGTALLIGLHRPWRRHAELDAQRYRHLA